jgi:hypothetical protein
MLLKNNGRYSDLYRTEADPWKSMGGVAWHQYFAVKTNNGKLAGKLGSIWINNNIFHNSTKF